MEPFGVIAAAVSLALEIKGFCDSLTTDSGNDRLVVQIKYDAETLESFAQIFRTVKTRSDLQPYEKELLQDATKALTPILERLHDWIDKKQRIQNKEINLAKQAVDKVTSLLWKNADMRRLSIELTAWAERYHIRLSLLPAEVREKLLRNITQGSTVKEGFETHMAVRDLRRSFKDLSLIGSHDKVPLVLLGSLLADDAHGRVFGSYDNARVIVEYKQYPETLQGPNLEQLTIAVERLVSILRNSNTQLCRILKCKGCTHQSRQKRYALVYELPFAADLGSKPQTLLDLIKSRKGSSQELLPPQHPLNQRFELARKVACAVLYVQAMGWVHKSIRTNNVIILEKGDSLSDAKSSFPRQLGNPYLCGFDTARQDKAASDQRGDAFWELNIYRHPARQGLLPEERYSMNHDIYSLGVVLLELGIWKPLLALSGLKALRPKNDAILVKGLFLKLAMDALPIVMGQKYSDLVKFCLEIDGENPVTTSTAIDEILSKLEEMSLGLH